MATTTNLAILLVDSSQAQQDVIVNEALEDIDAAMTKSAVIECTDGSNELAATADEAEEIMRRSARLELIDASPATSAAFDVVLPAFKRLLVVTNNTSYAATIVCDGAATGAEEATIAPGTSGTIYCDSTQVHQLVGGSLSVGAFTDLSDAPNSYTGHARKFVRVAVGEAELELSAGELAINAQIGTTYTLDLADAGALVTLDNGSAIDVTVPDESTADFPIGTQILLMQKGDGQVTLIEGATSVSIVTPETLKSRKKGAQMALVKIDADTWALEGNLEEAP